MRFRTDYHFHIQHPEHGDLHIKRRLTDPTAKVNEALNGNVVFWGRTLRNDDVTIIIPEEVLRGAIITYEKIED